MNKHKQTRQPIAWAWWRRYAQQQAWIYYQKIKRTLGSQGNTQAKQTTTKK